MRYIARAANAHRLREEARFDNIGQVPERFAYHPKNVRYVWWWGFGAGIIAGLAIASLFI